ncbi:MAG: guanylate kinase [Candidatus Tectomicrobia bacterium]|nr:guanylate kinase [Candidatus Tectomicrobia bacterium]
MSARRGHIFVLSAPSGAGKSSLIDRAVREIPGIWHSVSATTRPPRHYEKEGVHYFFLSTDAFHDLIKRNGFLEWAQVFGDHYGTPADAVDRRLETDEDVIMDLDVQGALQVKRRRPDATLVFIMPPSLEELAGRLRKRGAETEDRIQRRLARAEEEMSQRSLYDHVIVNAELDAAFRELAAIINAHRAKAAGGGA